MTESFLGVIIASIGISTLMLSIQSIQKSYNNAGKYSITQQELKIINSAGLNSESNLNIIKEDIDNLPQAF
tara:strand:- start:149 stop:361 length:213 start_codon:yes stop_codon:yes gene_type:complete